MLKILALAFFLPLLREGKRADEDFEKNARKKEDKK